MRITSLFLFSMLFLFSCTDDTKTYEQIVGEWECTSWTAENSSGDKCNNGNAYFKFNADKTYNSKLGATEDKGTYKIERGKLLAQPEGGMVIGVKIISLDEAGMEFLMNNGGVKENLKLRKK